MEVEKKPGEMIAKGYSRFQDFGQYTPQRRPVTFVETGNRKSDNKEIVEFLEEEAKETKGELEDMMPGNNEGHQGPDHGTMDYFHIRRNLAKGMSYEPNSATSTVHLDHPKTKYEELYHMFGYGKEVNRALHDYMRDGRVG